MIGNPALCSRLLFVFVPICAAVMSFIMCSDAARASPITTQVDYGVRHNDLRRLYPPHSQHRPLFSGLPSTETGLQTGTNGEIETSGNYRGASSIIDRRSNPVWFTEGSFSYNQNSPDNRQYRAGVRPASSSSSSSYRPLSYNSAIIRKSSLNKAAGPSHQSSSPSQVWDPKDAQKSYMNEKVPSLFSSQTGRYWSTSLPTSRGLYRTYKDTNELAAAGARSTSSGIQSSKYFGFASQTAPHAPSISNGLVIKSISSPEKLTDLSQGWHSVSSGDTPRHKKVQSYLFKNPQTSLSGHETTPHEQRASDAEHYSRFSSNVKQLERKDPIEAVQHLSDNANPLYHNANVAQYGAQTGGFTKHTTQMSVYPAPGKDANMGSFVPTPHADFRATGSSKSVVSSSINTKTRGSMHAHTPGRDVKSIYGFRGFENPTRTPILSSSGSNERTNAQQYSFDKGKGYKITNVYPSLSPKYSFGQRGAKPERTPTPSPGTHQDFTSGFASDASVVDRSPDRRQFRIDRRIYGLKGFSNRPLEGAKTLASEPDKSATVQQGFEGFKVRSSQTWQPRSSQNEQSSEDLKPLLQTESVTSFTPDEYQKRRKIYSFPGFLPIQTRIVIANNNNKTHKQNTESHIMSSSYVRSAEKLESRPKSEPRTPKETKPVERKASLFNRSTSSTVRGKRVRGNGEKLNASTPTNVNAPIVRLPKRPVRVITATYADILGSASFSGVAATTQTSITPTDNTAATTELKEEAGHWTIEDAVLSRDNTSRGPDEVDDVEENKFSVRSEDSDMKTSDLFLDNEGSGSGAFNMSDVLPTDTTESLSEDSSELEYLRISTGNVSFKSVKLSHTKT